MIEILILKAPGLKIVLFGTKVDFSPKKWIFLYPSLKICFLFLFCFVFFNGKENDLLIFKYCSYFFISNSLLVFFAIFLKNRGIIDLENSDLPSPYTKKATRKCQILTLINALKQIT